MKARILAVVVAVLGACALLPRELPSLPPGSDSPEIAIRAVLSRQQDAWNRGDLRAFMEGYWNSPELTFAGTSGIAHGFQPVIERYRRNYPDEKAMGHLDLSNLELRSLGKDAELVLGRWHLKRDSDELGGVFTLVLRQFSEGWRIIHDHTSQDAKAP
jgi:ketosteroid isomerase-like protein